MQNAINKGMILNLSSNADVFTRGEKYFLEGKILSTQFIDDPSGKTTVSATVEGHYKDYVVNVLLKVNGSLDYYSCSCDSHSIWRGACKHVVAVLFYLTQDKAILPGQKIRQARRLTDALEKCIFEDIDNRFTVSHHPTTANIKLVPCLHLSDRYGASLSFRLGSERLYVIKNLTSFAASVKKSETVHYGRKFQFVHNPQAFIPESRPLLDFIMREESMFAELIEQLGRQYYYIGSYRNDRRLLNLTERNMDTFFDLFAGGEIKTEADGGCLRFISGLPGLSLKLIHQDDETRLKATPFEWRLMHGQDYHYLVTHDALYRVDKGDVKIVTQLLKELADAPGGEIIFCGNERQRFLSVILPRLNRMGLIEDTVGDTPACIVPEMQAKLYFDDEGQDIVGKAEFVYAEDPPAVRDAVGEYSIKQQLSALGFVYEEKKERYRLTGNEHVYDFLHEHMEGLRESAEVFVTDNLRQKSIPVRSGTVGLRLEGNLLNIDLQDTGYSISELLEALDSYRERKKFHRMKDGRFLTIDENAAQMANIIDALDVSRKEVKGNTLTLHSYRAMYVNQLVKDAEAVRNDAFQQLVSNMEKPPDFDAPLPAVLREYQKTGFKWLKTLSHYQFGGILADDMGLGKTLQIIALLLSEKSDNASALVVAPTSLLYNWENEIKRFAPELTTLIVTGQAEKRKDMLQGAAAFDILITTYDMMKRDIAEYENLSFTYIIADEAQNIKNASTQSAKAIKELKGRVKFALTGTPIENSLAELWSIFDFIMPEYLRSHNKFRRLYEYPIVKNNDEERAARLRQQIAPFVLRRVKKSVLTELPEKTETMLQADMTDEQKKIYQAHLLMARGEMENISAKHAFAESRIQILAQLTRLRQICCHPSLFLEDYKSGSGKLDLAMETIQMAVESGHRILLFSQFTSMLELLKQAINNTKYSYFYLDGATKAQARMEMTKQFNEGKRDLFLISLKAGGTGLNLTGADVVIHYDPWWNPSVMDQASDRAHRFGQEKAVQVFNLVAKDSIEEKIMELQKRKRDLIDSVIAEGGSMIHSLTEEEMRALFE